VITVSQAHQQADDDDDYDDDADKNPDEELAFDDTSNN